MRGLEFRYFLWLGFKSEWIGGWIKPIFKKIQGVYEEFFGVHLVRRVGPENRVQERHEFENLKTRYIHLGGGF